MIRLLHHHGHPVGWQVGRAISVWDWLVSRAERLAGCPGPTTKECWRRHEAEHAAWRVKHGLPPLETDDDL